MHADEFLKPIAVENQNLLQVKVSEVPPEQARPETVNAPDALIFLGPVGFIVSWTVLFLMLSKVGTVARNEIFVSVNRLQRLPCRNCQFFANNAYLKCAVNPALVLTEKAFNCSDYSHKDSKLSS